MRLLRLRVNGEDHAVAALSSATLCEVLRESLRLTGTKQGCDEGNCGACTVLVDGRAVLSCLTLAIATEDHEVTTIEGLAQNGALHVLQESFDEHGAVQCGFCTPGMLLSAKAFLDRRPDAGVEAIKEALSGNLCRCTGYTRIVTAVIEAARRIAPRPP